MREVVSLDQPAPIERERQGNEGKEKQRKRLNLKNIKKKSIINIAGNKKFTAKKKRQINI